MKTSPSKVVTGPTGYSSQFFYAPDRSRYKQQANYGGASETTIYIGGLLEKVTLGAVTSWKHRISAANGVVALYTRKSTGANEMHYLTKDHLGSVDTITNAVGAVEARLSFSSAGQRRNEAGWSGNPSSADWSGITNTTRSGFTGHEHLDNLNLIHMNGRVYDPAAGRFLSPDPFIDGALNTQGWNRYAYVHNNPLSYSDPSGFGQVGADPVICADNASQPCGEKNDGGSGSMEHIEVPGRRLYDPPDEPFSLWDFIFNSEPPPSDSRGSDAPPGGGGGGVGEPQEQKPPCSGIAGAVQDFTGGASDQSFVDDVVNSYVGTTNFGVDNVIDNYAGTDLANTSGVPNPGLGTALGVVGAGTAARSWGGVTPMQAIGQAWNASRSFIRTPGLIGFRTPASLVATSGVTWAVGAAAIKGAYSTGVLVGSIARTAANHAATAACGK